MVTVDTPQQFDLARMKRLLGGPVLLGAEKMEDFDEFAHAMAASLDPGDMAAQALVYHYVMETWLLMRFRRLQGHVNRLHGINVENQAELAKATRTGDAEAQAFAAQVSSHATDVKIDFLLTQSAKRSHILLAQIAMYRVALAEKLRMQLDFEERQWKIKEMQRLEKEEEELQALSAEKETRANNPHPPTQSNSN
jgi:hypothetical protein